MQKVDCKGLACPKPVLTAKEYMDKYPNEIIEITVDNEASKENVSRFFKSQGWEVSLRDEEEGIFSITGAPGTCVMEFPETEAQPSEAQKILVFIPTDVVGQGDDELGGSLMKNFISTLKELGGELWRIILVNAGVKLAIQDSDCLDELKNLEDNGVSILVCGTCLNHFKLLDKKAVGETTNMLDILTSMQVASKIISV